MMTRTSRIAIVVAAMILAGCSKETEYIPVEIKRDFAAAPSECKSPVADDLPRVPDLPEGTTSAKAVNAHWAKAWLAARQAYGAVRDGYRVCQRHVHLRAKRQG